MVRVPIVLKRLTEADIQRRLSLRSRSLECFPPLTGDKRSVDFQVRDMCGRVWKFGLSTRRNTRHPKPVLSKGWLAFVHSKHLQISDRVVFYMEKEDDGSVTYRVKVEKAVKIFGAIHGWTDDERPKKTSLPSKI